ncbi:hypothetical protein ACN20G_08695 [Streptomyces sp. BI20]|uniref:hypothetical protein n=1 Tax=Streptomyces sp. BI20 TaxID=3403460 RepID=UPI003C78027B
MGSEARAELARLIAERGRDGSLLVPVDPDPDPGEDGEPGVDLPPGSMEFPPCRCPRCV